LKKFPKRIKCISGSQKTVFSALLSGERKWSR
jgi:hypothetical protein